MSGGFGHLRETKMILTKVQRQEFYEEEYLTIEDARPFVMIEMAHQVINARIEEG